MRCWWRCPRAPCRVRNPQLSRGGPPHFLLTQFGLGSLELKVRKPSELWDQFIYQPVLRLCVCVGGGVPLLFGAAEAHSDTILKEASKPSRSHRIIHILTFLADMWSVVKI